MGHSDALRQIDGVKDARQYTHAIQETIKMLRIGAKMNLTPGQMHTRECYVVLENDTPEERARVEKEVVEMPSYYAPYNTTVIFVDEAEPARLDRMRGMAHDGLVLAVGKTGDGNLARIEYANEWQSNAEGTAGVLVACARACHRLSKEEKEGAYTMLDIAPAYFSAHSKKELLKDFM